MMIKPNLFIVGAPKSGSSFLYDKLRDHQDLFFPKTKELNFFSYSILEASSYYKDYKVRSLEKYVKLFAQGKYSKYRVDASVSYFAYQEIASKIKKFSPSAKIIIILRNPVQRAFSHYLMDKRMGYAKKSFQEYIQSNTNSPYYHQYIGNSSYMLHVENYMRIFGKENVLVMRLDDLKKDLTSLFNFLGIMDIAAQIATTDRVNPNKESKNFVARFLQKNRLVAEKLKLIVPTKLVKKANLFLYKSPVKVYMTKEEEELASEILAEDIKFYSSLS
jgi:hypothetical protein